MKDPVTCTFAEIGRYAASSWGYKRRRVDQNGVLAKDEAGTVLDAEPRETRDIIGNVPPQEMLFCLLAAQIDALVQLDQKFDSLLERLGAGSERDSSAEPQPPRKPPVLPRVETVGPIGQSSEQIPVQLDKNSALPPEFYSSLPNQTVRDWFIQAGVTKADLTGKNESYLLDLLRVPGVGIVTVNNTMTAVSEWLSKE